MAWPADPSGPARPAAVPAGTLWLRLRSRLVFWFAAAIIALVVAMAACPGLFTTADPLSADLGASRAGPGASAWFGTDLQGADVFARTVYGARASLLVAVSATAATTAAGTLIGTAAAVLGGWRDTALMRITDVVFAVPMLLGGMVLMTSFPPPRGAPAAFVIGRVVLVLTVFGWPGVARLVRGSVLSIASAEYVTAARAMGTGRLGIVTRHLLPNALSPVIAVSALNLGAFIAAEATLSYLGIGLTPPAISWGVDIAAATGSFYAAPHALFFPGLFLSATVLAFVLLADCLRDALDPRMSRP